MEYEDKVRHAIKLLQSIPQDVPGGIEISYSTGKDSDVILELAKMAGIPYEAIYKNTTIDRPGSIKHAKDVGATIIQPKFTFLELVEKNGPPTRRARHCCRFLKEYGVKKRSVQGIRRCESRERYSRYKEPEVCRIYRNNDKVRIYLPILEWTDDDVERFINERDIKCHPHYYDSDGSFHVDRRVGCIGCPLQGDNGKKDFVKYPKLLKQILDKTQIWWDKPHPRSNSHNKFRDVYDLTFNNLFCKTYKDFIQKTKIDGLFPLNTKMYLEEYFGIDFADIYGKQ